MCRKNSDNTLILQIGVAMPHLGKKGSNPKHAYSEVSPILFDEAYLLLRKKFLDCSQKVFFSGISEWEQEIERSRRSSRGCSTIWPCSLTMDCVKLCWPYLAERFFIDTENKIIFRQNDPFNCNWQWIKQVSKGAFLMEVPSETEWLEQLHLNPTSFLALCCHNDPLMGNCQESHSDVQMLRDYGVQT